VDPSNEEGQITIPSHYPELQRQASGAAAKGNDFRDTAPSCHVVPHYPFFSGRGGDSPAVTSLLVTLAGDNESNPGPPT
jgi:hypothetical protein